MSHEDIVFNGNTFVDNLNLILRKEQSGITVSDLDSRQHMQNAAPSFINQFFGSFNTETFPFTDWDSFLSQWTAFTGDPAPNDLLTAFVNDFKAQIGYTDPNLITSDWHALSTTIQGVGNDADGFPLGVTDPLIIEYFKRSFSHFLATYPYVDPNDISQPAPIGGRGVVGSLSNFFTNWVKFMTRTAEFDDGTSTAPSGGADFAAYEQIYATFFPPLGGETAQDVADRYAARLRMFWKEQALNNGALSVDRAWFIPSQSFDEWFEELREEFIRGVTVRSTQLFTVSTPATQRVLVIDRILRLLIEMIDILQRISATQAQRLSFLTAWQQAYTDLITQVPTFTSGDRTPLGFSDNAGDERYFRNSEVNNRMQAILEKVRARRSEVQDEAKAMQTTINQSQDAANQQTQLGTALIQQLATILSAIFR